MYSHNLDVVKSTKESFGKDLRQKEKREQFWFDKKIALTPIANKKSFISEKFYIYNGRCITQKCWLDDAEAQYLKDDLINLQNILFDMDIKERVRLPWWLRGQRICLQCKSLRFDAWLERPPGEGNGNPLQYWCLENSMDRGAWWATVLGSQSWTWLSD